MNDSNLIVLSMTSLFISALSVAQYVALGCVLAFVGIVGVFTFVVRGDNKTFP